LKIHSSHFCLHPHVVNLTCVNLTSVKFESVLRVTLRIRNLTQLLSGDSVFRIRVNIIRDNELSE
jgi:predicted nuclease of predicted toxin-antitoxin system